MVVVVVVGVACKKVVIKCAWVVSGRMLLGCLCMHVCMYVCGEVFVCNATSVDDDEREEIRRAAKEGRKEEIVIKIKIVTERGVIMMMMIVDGYTIQNGVAMKIINGHGEGSGD